MIQFYNHCLSNFVTYLFVLFVTVAISVYAFGKNYSSGDKVLFPYVHATSGGTATELSSLKSTGMFVCKQPGLYLISIFLLTLYHTNRSVYILKGPSYVCIASVYFRQREQIAATVLTRLNMNDHIYIQINGDLNIYGGQNSCMSIVQIA